MLATTYPTSASTCPDIVIDPTLFDLGFRHGKVRMMRGSLADNTSYALGFATGLKLYRSTLPAPIEAPLERGWGDELLNPID